jgi:hypothetical protein
VTHPWEGKTDWMITICGTVFRLRTAVENGKPVAKLKASKPGAVAVINGASVQFPKRGWLTIEAT